MITVFLKKIKRLASNRRISFLVLFFAIASKTIQLVFFYNIRVDGSFQYMAMQNFIYGHGISIAYVSPNNLSSILYRPLIEWPPGYSLLLAPFYLLFEPNYIAAGLTLEILALMVLLFTSRAILKLFETPIYLQNIFTLFQGCFIYYFYFIDSSDEIAIPFFLLAVYQTLLFLKVCQKKFFRISVVSFCLLASAYIKYHLIPVTFVVPVYLMIKGFFAKEKKIINAGLLSFLILIIGIACLMIYDKMISNSVGYISQPDRGFFPQHILDAYPFAPASFINPDTVSIFVGARSTQLIKHVFQIINLALIVIAAKYLVVSFFKDIREKKLLVKSYLHLLFFISLAITILLTILSVCVAKEEILPGVFWTYVEEARYYGLAIVMIQLAVFIFFSDGSVSKRKKYFLGILILILMPEFFRGLVFDINRIRFWKKEEYSWQYEDRFQKYADSILKKGQEKFSWPKIVITGTSYYINHRISLYSHIPILSNVQSINKISTLHTNEPVLLLAILKKNDLNVFRPFLASTKELVGQFDDFYFYTVYVEPH